MRTLVLMINTSVLAHKSPRSSYPLPCALAPARQKTGLVVRRSTQHTRNTHTTSARDDVRRSCGRGREEAASSAASPRFPRICPFSSHAHTLASLACPRSRFSRMPTLSLRSHVSHLPLLLPSPHSCPTTTCRNLTCLHDTSAQTRVRVWVDG